MTSKKELKLAYGILVACLVVGLLGYSVLPAKSPESPIRKMYKTTGGDVLFDHQSHSDNYGLYCEDCHHAYRELEKEMPDSCGRCHQPDGKYQPALGDKGMFKHDAHAQEYGLYCNDCHHNYQQGDPEPPQHCTACHQRGMGDDMMPGRKDAFHQQCIGCHEDFGVMPGKTDCAGCHAPRNRTEAFHDQCMNCHEDFGVGPTQSDCNQCHGY
ncbi:MAG: cytochrome c3 family protein [Desulfobacterales bacterium]|nr:cytochrome c3 family protein [Desulfobacterales bacterium]